MNKSQLVILFSLLFFSACRNEMDEITIKEDIDDIRVIENYTPPTNMIIGSVTGFVVDEAEEPIAGAIVTINNLSTATDDFGHFSYKNIEINQLGALVQIEKSGYFLGSRRFFPVENSESRVKIELLNKEFSAVFDSNLGGEIKTDEGAKLAFLPNSISLENSTLYDGEVRVAMKWLNPTALQTFNQMPGNLQGVDWNNREVSLRSYGMMAVELEGAAGEKLNIAKGQKATISMPVPSVLQNNAPPTIPLWSYNEDYGIWLEEQTATLENGNYVGQVNHFSFWNCDLPGDQITLTLQVVNQYDKPLYNFQVLIEFNNSVCISAYTGENGMVTGPVLANTELTITIYDDCDNIVFTQIVNPSSNDIDLGTLPLNETGFNPILVSGNLVGCQGATIDNGLVIINPDNGPTIYEYIDENSFEIYSTTCDDATEIEIYAIDLDNFTQSESQFFAPMPEYDAGTLDACAGDLENFFSITADGITVQYTEGSNGTFSANFPPQSLETVSLGYQDSSTQPVTIVSIPLIDGFAGVPGSFPGSVMNVIQIPSEGWSSGGETIFLDDLTITEFGMPGELVKGTFSGSFVGGTPANLAFTGAFSLIRE